MRTIYLLLLLARVCSAQAPFLSPITDPAAPGSWLTIYGFGFTLKERTWQSSDFKSNVLPTSLAGVSVKINGKSAAIAYVSAIQINALVPPDAGTGTVPITVTTSNGAIASASVTLQPFAPQWLGPALHADGAPVLPNNPAEPGETISAYGTGFGPTSPEIDPMVVWAGVAPLAGPNDLAITMGNQKAAVTFAGLTGNGLYQFNFVVPPLPEANYNLRASINGSQTNFFTTSVMVITPGPPVITGMVPNDFIWGQQSDVTLKGTGLAGASTIAFSDPDHLTPQGDSHIGPRLALEVQENATPGTRTITVTTTRGKSNAFPFTIRRGEPRITSLTPSTVWPGRAYPFTVEGVDMAGVKSLEVTPATGVRELSRLLQLDSSVPAGTLQVRLKSPWDTSPPATLQVVPAPATAPAIRSLSPISISTYNANIQGAFSERADYTGEFEFTDADGDIKSGSRMEMIAEINGFAATASGKIELTAKPNTVRFTITKFARISQYGLFPVWITLFDEAGNRSNAIKGAIDVWWN